MVNDLFSPMRICTPFSQTHVLQFPQHIHTPVSSSHIPFLSPGGHRHLSHCYPLWCTVWRCFLVAGQVLTLCAVYDDLMGHRVQCVVPPPHEETARGVSHCFCQQVSNLKMWCTSVTPLGCLKYVSDFVFLHVPESRRFRGRKCHGPRRVWLLLNSGSCLVPGRKCDWQIGVAKLMWFNLALWPPHQYFCLFVGDRVEQTTLR